jgi:tetratricopeptide (TPR) repeat protein
MHRDRSSWHSAGVPAAAGLHGDGDHGGVRPRRSSGLGRGGATLGSRLARFFLPPCVAKVRWKRWERWQMGEGDSVTSLEAGPPHDRRGARGQHPGATPRRARPRRTLLYGEAGAARPTLDPGPNPPPAELLLGATMAEPFGPLACVRLGYLLLDLGQLEDAHAAFRRAIAAEPHLADAWRGLATLLERNGDWCLAAATLHRATRCTDRHPSDWGRLARVLERHGRPEAARSCLRRWAKDAPQDPQPRIRLGRLCLESNRLEEARLVLETAIRLAPEGLDARLLLVRVHLRAGRLEAAFGVAQAAVDLAPAEPAVVRAFAAAAQLAGRPGLAVRRCAALLASAGDDADTRIALGLLHQAQGRTESARRHLRRAIELAPRSGEAFLRFVQVGRIPPGDRALLREMERRAADEALPRAARVRIHFALGKAWEDLGDHPRANEHFRRGNALEAPASPLSLVRGPCPAGD